MAKFMNGGWRVINNNVQNAVALQSYKRINKSKSISYCCNLFVLGYYLVKNEKTNFCKILYKYISSGVLQLFITIMYKINTCTVK